MSVVWINESPSEFFPLAYDDLEALFYKHNKKVRRMRVLTLRRRRFQLSHHKRLLSLTPS